MGGKHARKFFFQKNEYREQKTMEKNRLEKVRKHVFYKHTNIVTKKWGEKISRRINNVTKKGGKNSRKKFFHKKQISQANNDKKNRLEKVRIHVFYKHTNIVTKKWGGKNEKKIFPETRISRAKNDGKNSSGKVRKHFFL